MIKGMGLSWRAAMACVLLLLSAVVAAGQAIEFESGGLRYYALTRNGLTVMVAQLPAHIRDYAVLQVAVSNGGTTTQVIRPEDFLFIRDDGSEVPAVTPRIVVNSMVERASRS